MRRFLVAGNWKMNTTRAAGVALARELAAVAAQPEAGVEVLVCPPFPYLLPVGEALVGSAVKLGAQDVYFEAPGAFTGEVAVEMLKDCGCGYVILGHSERRHVMGETDQVINKKVKAALAGGLTVVLCVGELLSERQAGKTESVLDTQMAGGLEGVSEADAARIVIAYEPVWAIGTGKASSAANAQSVHGDIIRPVLSELFGTETAQSIRILYGGSVTAANAAEFFSQPDIDGALVGGASLKVDDFLAIAKAAVK